MADRAWDGDGVAWFGQHAVVCRMEQDRELGPVVFLSVSSDARLASEDARQVAERILAVRELVDASVRESLPDTPGSVVMARPSYLVGAVPYVHGIEPDQWFDVDGNPSGSNLWTEITVLHRAPALPALGGTSG